MGRPRLAPVYYEARGLLAVASLCDALGARLAEERAVTRAPLKDDLLQRAWRLRDDALDRLDGVPALTRRMKGRCDALRARIAELTHEIEAASLALVTPARPNLVEVDFRARKVVIR